MRYFSALCARMYRFSANSRATISSTAIFLSQQSRQYLLLAARLGDLLRAAQRAPRFDDRFTGHRAECIAP